jgi:hypothetical protein
MYLEKQGSKVKFEMFVGSKMILISYRKNNITIASYSILLSNGKNIRYNTDNVHFETIQNLMGEIRELLHIPNPKKIMN